MTRSCGWILVLLVIIACEVREPIVVMAIGDSNGAAKDGWVSELKELRADLSIYNYSISGNTIGFDNLDQDRLNTRKNWKAFFEDMKTKTEALDYVILLLGTNDCKAIFRSQINEVVAHLDTLLGDIQSDDLFILRRSSLVLVSPPPYGPDSTLASKYQGGAACVEHLIPEYQRLAEKHDLVFVDVHSVLRSDFSELSKDGIHLTPEGQKKIAHEISKFVH